MPRNLFIEVIGWYGAIAILLAYILNSFSIITSADIWYQLLNVTGAISIILASYIKRAYQPMVLNVIWVIIGVIAIIEIIR